MIEVLYQVKPRIKFNNSQVHGEMVWLITKSDFLFRMFLVNIG
jgi:hypothetical protein